MLSNLLKTGVGGKYVSFLVMVPQVFILIADILYVDFDCFLKEQILSYCINRI